MARRYTFARPLRGRLWTLSANTYYYVLRLLEDYNKPVSASGL